MEQRGYDDAAASVRDDLGDTIALMCLGASLLLARLLATTNLIESLFAQCTDLARGRVKRWRHGEQAGRWAAFGLAQAEASLHPCASPPDLAALASLLAVWAQPYT